MSADAALYLADIVESYRLILDYTRGMTAVEFRADRKTVDAVVRNLDVIGEAVKHLPAPRTTVPTWIGERSPASGTF